MLASPSSAIGDGEVHAPVPVASTQTTTPTRTTTLAGANSWCATDLPSDEARR